ncbi:MAG: hypothetical protein PHR10_04040 [Sphaerochaetaceae bacterium]|jgi:hypothetical protein|nr:hypothetical protein [Sphaerochaetaceae bacterium]
MKVIRILRCFVSTPVSLVDIIKNLHWNHLVVLKYVDVNDDEL